MSLSIPIAIICLVKPPTTTKIEKNTKEPQTSWELIFSGDYFPSTNAEDQDLRERARSYLDKTSNESFDIEYFAQLILKKSIFQRVNVFRVKRNKIIVSHLSFTPFLQLEAAVNRLISTSGKVYGISTDVNLPVLSGVIANDEKPRTLNEMNLIDVTAQEQILVDEAICLEKELQAVGLRSNKLISKKFRGFIAEIKDPQIKVSFGRKPFKGKIKRLLQIIARLDKKKNRVSSIELDFDNKAFIKEIKL